ncbi:Host cell factor 1 [Frankliniella fusca]|uniref:Host cell factor 1 n=1 Tax=Frankliniella fusca TaxID=407009 RepID=A0AAE1L8H2_9NEOP|nr:Host cell factor 1 [Frankliniella fusca]
MEDSETMESLLLEDTLEEPEKSSEEIDAAAGDGTDDVADESLEMVQEGELVDGVMDNEDSEMADGVAEDSANNNIAPEDSMDAAAMEGGDGSEEVSQGTLSTSEGLLGVQFISQDDSLIVQNEPPQQLMEETEGDGEPAEGEVEGDGAIVAEADTTDEPSESLEKNETGEELGEEALLLHQGGEGLLPEGQDESETVDLGALPEGMTLISEQMEDEAEAGAEAEAEAEADLTDDAIHGEGETADDQGETTDEAMEVPPDDEEGAENSASVGTDGVTLLAGSDQLSEQALNELEGKIAAVTDGTSVQLLPGQENLQGMQLMEGDDKPEDAESTLQGQVSQKEIQDQLNAALMKQEEMKVEDDQPESDSFPERQQNAEADALATLASAALDHQAPTNGVKTEADEQIKTESDSSEPQWMDVGICKGTHCQVRSYYVARPGQGWDQNWDGVTTSTLPDHRALAKLELESGKAYKFRVAAINSCGRFPGAPSAIKIAKTADGAHLSWEPPPIASGVIEDYHVYLAVRTATTDSSKQVVSSGANQLAFVRIYQGAANQCSVGNDTLSKAHIDMTTKPAILFRISARNEKGIGPATQVRWLQEVGAPSNPARPAFAPRRPATDSKPHGNYKRKKSE